MSEFLYDVNGFLIAGGLLLSMWLIIEFGYRIGAPVQEQVSEDYKSHVNSITGSLLGILALLLGFTFSLSLQRYDSRCEAVVQEANAIGTTYLRSFLLPESVRGSVKEMLLKYVDLRVRTGEINLTEHELQRSYALDTGRMQAKLWDLAVQAAELDPSPVRTGLFIQALNDLNDNYSQRDAEMDRHVPELVLGLLYVTFVMTGMVVGYATGLSGYRASFVTHILSVLIVILVFIILDLDRPHRGLIMVSQKSMLDLQATINESKR